MIGLLGLGTVGAEVFQAFTQNHDNLQEKTGFSFVIKKILVKNPKKPRNVKVPNYLLTTKFEDILKDPEITLIVELLGGLEPAASYIQKALQASKNVITANKAVMATYGEELLSLAGSRNVDLFFEASVAGAIPILRPLQESLATDRILEVSGIVNGTTNYILTQMTHQGTTYEAALMDAQRLGYAEPDPTFDVTGMDAAYKIAILGSRAFGYYAKGEQVFRVGITEILPADIQDAKDLGYRVKLLASARCDNNELSLSVAPTLVPHHHPLYNVEGPYNAILVRGERLGDIMFYGQGAGGVPTSTAIVSDIVQAAKNYALDTSGKSVALKDRKVKLKPFEDAQSRFYFRLEVEDQPGTLAAIAQIFAGKKVSFSSIIQKENNSRLTDIVFITHLAYEGLLQNALKQVQKLPFVNNIRSVLRVES